MKNVFLTTLALFAVFLSSGQVEIHLNGTNVAGTQIDRSVGQFEGHELHIDFLIINTSGSEQDISVSREIINEQSSWEDRMCLGKFGSFGQCYTFNQMITNPWTSADTFDISIGDTALLSSYVKAKDPDYGCAIYRYRVIDGNSILDSVDVNVCMLLDINTIEPTIEASIFPSPANSKLTIALTDQQKTSISLIDVTGNVLQNEITTSQLSIDTSGLPNGMYFVKLEQEGKKVTYKKVIIQH